MMMMMMKSPSRQMELTLFQNSGPSITIRVSLNKFGLFKPLHSLVFVWLKDVYMEAVTTDNVNKMLISLKILRKNSALDIKGVDSLKQLLKSGTLREVSR